jgi:energy-coupling factor transporter transmembrane protein EcfT
MNNLIFRWTALPVYSGCLFTALMVATFIFGHSLSPELLPFVGIICLALCYWCIFYRLDVNQKDSLSTLNFFAGAIVVCISLLFPVVFALISGKWLWRVYIFSLPFAILGFFFFSTTATKIFSKKYKN